MGKAREKLKEELLALLPPMAFFFVSLHLAWFIRVLVLEGTAISVGTSVSVTVGSLVLAKAVLIADLLPFINRYPGKPLVYNIAWKTAIYLVAAGILHYLERLVEAWRVTDGLVAANELLLSEMVWPHFWALQIVLFLLVLIYCTTVEAIRVVGRERVWRTFFGPLPAPER
jgi:hypothetical protein